MPICSISLLRRGSPRYLFFKRELQEVERLSVGFHNVAFGPGGKPISCSVFR